EAILIFTILGIGLLVGIVAVRNALVQYSSYRSHNRFIVADSSDPAVVLGQVVGFDPHETPLVPFVDYNPEGEVIEANQVNYRALIGVRPSRFTSRQPVFYTEADCGSQMGAVCLAEPGSDAANATFSASGVMEETGSISYVYPMQSSPSYGIG